MNYSVIRKLGREDLKGNWTNSVIILVIYSLILSALSFFAFYTIGVISILIGGALELGLTNYFFNLRRNPEFAEINNLFEGFKYFTDSLCIYLLKNLYIILWTILLIIPGIIKSIAYTMTYYVYLDNKKLSANDCIKRSQELMKGHKWEYFVFCLTFIGWFLLGLLCFGIGVYWVEAYFNASKMNFYEKILEEYNEKNNINLNSNYTQGSNNNSYNENEIIIENVKSNEEIKKENEVNLNKEDSEEILKKEKLNNKESEAFEDDAVNNDKDNNQNNFNETNVNVLDPEIKIE